ncbi:MAG: hypothetical protein IJ802_01430, partial [Kiritimatiellae bacterium]|nr:hypothetical protein [Kiritimatiellia bacterium]
MKSRIDAALNTDKAKGEVAKRREVVPLGNMPESLVAIGLPSAPVETRVDIIRKLNKSHSLTAQQIAELPGRIADPVAVFKDGESYIILTDLQAPVKDGAQKPVMVVLRAIEKANGEKVFLASAYAREAANENKYEKIAASADSLLYLDEKRIAALGLEERTISTLNSQASGNNTANLAENGEKVKREAHVKNLAENTGEVFTDGKDTIEFLGFDHNGQYRIRANGTEERIADIGKIQSVFAPGGKWRRLEGKEKRDHLQKSAEARFPGFKYTNNFDVVKATSIAAWGGADPEEGGDQMLADLLQIVRKQGHLLPKPRRWNDWRRAVGQWRRHGHHQVPGASAPNSKFPTFDDYHVTGDGEILDELLAIADDKSAINLIFGTGKGVRHGSPDEADLTGNLPEYFHPTIEKLGAAGFVQYYLGAVAKYREWAKHQRRMLTDPEYYGAAMAERYGENWSDTFNAKDAEAPQNNAEDYAAAAGAGADATDFNVDELESGLEQWDATDFNVDELESGLEQWDATDFNVDELESGLEQRDADYYSNDYVPDPFDLISPPEVGSEGLGSFSVTVKDMEEARIQYNAVVRRYTNADGTKKPGWMKAPNGKPTNLTERQWVQVRTPNFKRWFGDWELQFATADENQAKEIIAALRKEHREFTNILNDRKAELKSDWGKIFSAKAKGQSVSFEAHYAAAARIDTLFENGIKYAEEKPRNNSADIEAYAKYACPFSFGGEVYLAKITVKEYPAKAKIKDGVYSVEALVVEKAANGGNNAAIAKIKGQSLDPDAANNLAQLIENVNNVSKIVDENGEPRVVWHGDADPSFTTFDNNKIQRGTGFWFTQFEGEA